MTAGTAPSTPDSVSSAELNVYASVADAIGNTPLVRLNRVTEGIEAAVYAKLEFLNPGGSVKDRAARAMIDAAELSGDLRPGGTVVEGTSGNTGIGLAVVAASRGYRTIVVVPDKSSAEKISFLRAHGADVRVTKGALPTHHPDHVRNVARRIADEIDGGWLAGQYDNPANPGAHYVTTGPELWRQTQGRITHFVAGVGTGGTISGTGKFLKEVSGGAVRVIGADPETSRYSGGDGRAYYVESIGHFVHPDSEEDIWPDSYDRTVVDEFVTVADRESIDTVRSLARTEGLLVGGSGGTAVAAALRHARTLPPDAVVVVLIPDSGRAYLSKYFDDDWVARLGFDTRTSGSRVVEDLPIDTRVPFAVPADATVGEALALLDGREELPVVLARATPGPTVVAEITGAVERKNLLDALTTDPVTNHVSAALAVVGAFETVDAAVSRAGGDRRAVVVASSGSVVGSISAADLQAGES
ncbi:PLP-dependent cysteine synthase family protein [Rhodococcus yunnanensis]|uniref:PLP-dependent cysteine synthase family protein n=1 Tax=Rhodococcoides yunnanense TaxID=278209 RepID=UPI0009335D37|nr:pyridoxal-phosphate dependent enzyme [Rhodococcus yunnanensis]